MKFKLCLKKNLLQEFYVSNIINIKHFEKIFSKTSNEMISKINTLCEKYYSSILQFFNKDNLTHKKSLILDPSECLLDLTKCISSFIEYLWEKPDFIAKILINSDLNDSKNILFPLFFNRFYQNIFSQNFIEQNLLYVVTIILKDEINKKEFNKLNFEENNRNNMDKNNIINKLSEIQSLLKKESSLRILCK